MKFPREAPAREPVFLTSPEVDAIIGGTPDEHQTFIRFLVGTGLRRSEATALRTVGLDLTGTHGAVSITHAWKEIGGAGWRIGQPRTPRARRTAVLPKSTTTALTAHVKGRRREGLLFSGRDGGMIWNTDKPPAVTGVAPGTLSTGSDACRTPAPACSPTARSSF